MQKKFIWLLTICLFSLASLKAQSNIVMQVVNNSGPIEGESILQGFPKWIMVTAYNQGSENTIQTGGGGGGPTVGVPRTGDFTFTICVDKSANPLKRHLYAGTLLNSITVNFLNPIMGSSAVYYKIEMEDIYITSISEAGSVGGDQIYCNITFAPTKFRYTYWPTNPNGSLGIPNIFGWNRATNTPW